jgi:hypothetical protein
LTERVEHVAEIADTVAQAGNLLLFEKIHGALPENAKRVTAIA